MRIEIIEDAYNICEVCSNKPTLKLTTKWGVNFFCESCFDELKKLEKPKKKVKKWQWLIFDKEDNSVYATNLRFTCEAEVQKYLEDEETDRVLYPIKESEIEVEVE